MVRGGKDAMQEGPRGDKHEAVWWTRLTKQGQNKATQVGSILRTAQEGLVDVAPVRRESQWSLVKRKWDPINQSKKSIGNSMEKQEGQQMQLEVKTGAWVEESQNRHKEGRNK